MSEAKAFLQLVENKLQKRIRSELQSLQYGKEEIHRMNEFFWDNYTEMDEYGYEDYDNQRVLMRQADANEKKKAEIRKLMRMQDSPFFGGLYFLYEDEDEPEMFYIGIGDFSENPGEPLIFDWRAPVSSMFYDYDLGPAGYQAPMGYLEGELLKKYQYKIRRGQMLYELENETKIDDDILLRELGSRGSDKMKNIIRTIQGEQNQIIRNTSDRILVIQGAAGSGKTSIAMHRIAYLLYHERERLKSSQVLILSPNGVFADYISQILPELGEENIREMSFDIYAYHQLKDVVKDTQDRFLQMEEQMQMDHRKVEDEIYRYKQSVRFTEDMEGFLLELEDRLMDFHDVTFQMKLGESDTDRTAAMTMSVPEILELFYDKFASAALLERMDQIAERFIDEFETLYLFRKGLEMSPEEKEAVRKQFREMYRTMDIYEIYRMFLEDRELPLLPEVPKEERYLRYEDVYPILYLKYRLHRKKPGKMVRHLIIDEMQDYSYLQYRILGILFDCSMTILGDRAQALEPGQQDVLTFLPKLLGKDCRILSLKRSYRNTTEISAYADQIQHIDGIDYFERSGDPVEIVKTENMDEIISQLEVDLAEVPEEYETICVITLRESEAIAIWNRVKEMKFGHKISYLDRNSRHFSKGITVTTWYMAKGLEFDQVFMMPVDKNSVYRDQYRYIAATRAMHRLKIYEY